MAKWLLATVAYLAAVGQAMTPPNYPGYGLRWKAEFQGKAGSLPDRDNWNIISGNLGVNAELETYRASSKYVQQSGGGTLQIVPWRDSSAPGGWSSGRIESKHVFVPKGNAITRLEAKIRFGTNPMSDKQGLWPAFWMLGDSLRHGGQWPECGEIDVMEQIDGQLVGHGTLDCDVNPGGICNESTGLTSSVQIPNQGWHTWRVQINRKPDDWRKQSITWFLDGKQFHQITGARINNEGVWDKVAHSNLYFILNMAVGGSWPGNPNGSTKDGYGSMMEVGYVAHYSTN